MASDRLRSTQVLYFDIVIVQSNPSKAKGFHDYVVSYFNDLYLFASPPGPTGAAALRHTPRPL